MTTATKAKSTRPEPAAPADLLATLEAEFDRLRRERPARELAARQAREALAATDTRLLVLGKKIDSAREARKEENYRALPAAAYLRAKIREWMQDADARYCRRQEGAAESFRRCCELAKRLDDAVGLADPMKAVRQIAATLGIALPPETGIRLEQAHA